MLELIWLIPLLPVAGLSINGLFGRRMSRGAVGAVACGAVLLSLLVSAGAVWELSGLPEEGRRFETELASTWMPLGANSAFSV